MSRDRLEAFSDAVLAVVITIMVLNLRPPAGHDFTDLLPLLPKLAIYLVSFVFVAIYWNNHHHLFLVVDRISGRATRYGRALLRLARAGSGRCIGRGDSEMLPRRTSFEWSTKFVET